MKKILFGVSLLIGIFLSVGVLYCYQISDLALYIAFISLSTSTITAVYSILAEPDPYKKLKLEIYGKLKKTLHENISKLKNKNYQHVVFGEWDDIQVDDRHQLVNKDNEELRKKLDALLQKNREYNLAVDEFNKILPRAVKDVAIENFDREPSTVSSIELRIRLRRRSGDKPEFVPITNLLDHLKKGHSQDDLVKCAIKEVGMKREEISDVGMTISFNSGRFTTSDEKGIIIFWNNCLHSIQNLGEYRSLVEKNEVLLKESEEILPEIIKQIDKTMKS